MLTLLRASGYMEIAKFLRYFAANPWQVLNAVKKYVMKNEWLWSWERFTLTFG